MKQREALFGFGGVVLGFLLATVSLLVAEHREAHQGRMGDVVHTSHLAAILHDGRLQPLSARLENEISTGIRLLDNEKLSADDVHALRAVDKICRTRGIVLTAEANAVLVKHGARAE